MPTVTAEPGLAEPGSAEPGSVYSSSPLILIRRPVLDVKIDGVSQSKILSAACHFGFDQRYATAEVVFKETVGIDPTYWSTVEITMGAGENNVPRFFGYVVPLDNEGYPRHGILRCRGPLGITATLQNADNTWNPLTNTYGTHFALYDLTGTIAKTSGSSAIVGTGTNFTSLFVGCPVVLLGTTGSNGQQEVDRGTVATITDDTHMTISPAPTHTASGAHWMRGRTDQDIAAFILAYYGLSSRYIYVGGPTDTIAGTGRFLGSWPPAQALTWTLGAEGLPYLEGLDDACAAQDANNNWGLYKTFETVGGEADATIFRTLITGNPQGDSSTADFSLTEGVDLLRDLQTSHDTLQGANGVRVLGAGQWGEWPLDPHFPYDDPASPGTPWIPVDGGSPPPYLTASSPYLPSFLPNNPTTGYPLVFRDFTVPFIERSLDTDPWEGLVAEDKARQLLQWLNTELVTLRGTTHRDDLFGPGQTHYVYAPVRGRVWQTMFVNALDITMSPKRTFRQTMTWVVRN